MGKKDGYDDIPWSVKVGRDLRAEDAKRPSFGGMRYKVGVRLSTLKKLFSIFKRKKK